MTTGAVVALLALAAAVLPAGIALARALGLGASGLERWVIGAALGRIGFAAISLLLAEAGALALLPLWCVAGVAWLFAGGLLARHRAAAAPHAEGPLLARAAPGLVVILSCVAASALLVHAVVARSGRDVGPGVLAAAGATRGDLLFAGRDSTNDPLVYLSIALRLEQTGLPLTLPFGGGEAATSSYVPYAAMAGAHAIAGGDGLDVAFRAQPFFDVTLAALSGAALAARLGAGVLGAGAAGVLLVLGSEPSFLAAPLGALAGRTTQPLDSWALFGPYLFAFNPIAPAVGALFAALLLLAAPGPPRAGAAVCAGVLVASLFETKLFLWAPTLAALGVVAFVRPPPLAARTLRIATVVAVAASLPSLVEKAWWARELAGRDTTGFQLCIGCLPRYLADAAWGSHELSFALFRAARPSDVLSPGVALPALGASVLLLAFVLGARAFAWPLVREALRSVPDADADTQRRHAAIRVLALAAAAGLFVSLVIVVSPHYMNGAQFAWSATFGLWPLVALVLERALRARRLALAALVLVLALPSSVGMLARLGYGAAPSLRVTAAERELMETLGRVSQPGDLVLEPSMLEDPDRPSAAPWLAGRPVYLSLLSAVLSMPAAEREARFDRIVSVFAESDSARAETAIRTSGARWVIVTPRFPLRWDPAALLEPVFANAAGILHRVRER